MGQALSGTPYSATVEDLHDRGDLDHEDSEFKEKKLVHGLLTNLDDSRISLFALNSINH